MEEIWKEVKGYEEYQVSNFGNVKSKRFDRNLKPRKNGKGYLSVKLNRKQFYIHRIVALNFIPNPLNLTDVNHIDEIKNNNNIYNLEWMNHRDNRNYSIDKSKTTSQFTNISWHKKSNKWQVNIKFNKKIYWIGVFKNEEDANNSVIEFKKQNNIK